MSVVGTAVLVHGAWQGAWCWQRLAPLLRDAGVGALTPTLTGSGTRADELAPDIGPDTHVADVVAEVRAADDQVVVVGHSYSGMLLPGVADAIGDRLVGVVYVDAFYARHGDSALGLMPEPFPDRFRALAAADGDGWRLPASDALLDIWGLEDPDDRTWVRNRLTDWSLTCFEAPSNAPAGRIGTLPRWYVEGTKDCPSRSVFAPMAGAAASDGCTVVGAPSGHDVMIEAPDTLATVITDALTVGT